MNLDDTFQCRINGVSVLVPDVIIGSLKPGQTAVPTDFYQYTYTVFEGDRAVGWCSKEVAEQSSVTSEITADLV